MADALFSPWREGACSLSENVRGAGYVSVERVCDINDPVAVAEFVGFVREAYEARLRRLERALGYDEGGNAKNSRRCGR